MNTRITSYGAAESDIRAVRDAVFGAEQEVPRGLDWDGADPDCAHVVASDDAGSAVGTGRLMPDGRIGRLSVLKPWRGQGVGARMLEALVDAACRRGLETVYLHAQLQAAPFYGKRGFVKDGEVFTEAGIRHVNMTREILPTRRKYGIWSATLEAIAIEKG